MNAKEIFEGMTKGEEIWKPVVGYERLYEISNMGVLKSYQRGWTGRIIKPQISNHGYQTVSITKIKTKGAKIHRLVCEAFLPNPLNKPHVNHISGIKTDNRVDNLEWATVGENMAHSYKIGLRRNSSELIEKQKKGNSLRKVSIIQLDINGAEIKKWDGIKEACRSTGIRSITHCLHGRQLTAGGYIWKFA